MVGSVEAAVTVTVYEAYFSVVYVSTFGVPYVFAAPERVYTVIVYVPTAVKP